MRARSRRTGRWTPLWILMLVLSLGWFGTPTNRRQSLVELRPSWWPKEWSWKAIQLALVEARSQDTPVEVREAWIDPASLDWQLDAALDPRWSLELRHGVAELDPFLVGDLGAFEELKQRLEQISFVERVVSSEPDAESGCELELVLRQPVACVPCNGLFYGVDKAGVLLSGSWERPLYRDGLPLPVLGPISDGESLFSRARPGDWLVEEEHLDALDVALSMDEHLSRPARTALGRLVIQATDARQASLANPGVRLLLGGQRLVLFGRPARTEEPGELPVERKWSSLEECLVGEQARSLDGWGLLDLRWDHPEVDLLPVLLAQAEPAFLPERVLQPKPSEPHSLVLQAPERNASRVR